MKKSITAIFLTSRLLTAPQEALFTLLIFILSKSFASTPLQLTILACLKPITALFAFYISSAIFDKPHRIRLYLLLNNIVGLLPCLLYPYMQNVWFFIASYGIFMTTTRAMYPAWIEVLKRRLDFTKLSQAVSRGSLISYAMMIFFPLAASLLIDHYDEAWRYLFFALAIFQLFNSFIILWIEIDPISASIEKKRSLENLFFEPIKKGWELFQEKPAFKHYQILFFLGGAGLIGIQPILPIYFKETLHLTYTQIAIVFSLCKGIAFLSTTPLWRKYVNNHSLYNLNSLVNLFSSIFFGFLILSQTGANWLLPAYLFYGAMQAGCEISWNLSGPIFSIDKESTIYSSMNLIVIGVRGCICPFLGHLLFSAVGAQSVFILGFSLCFLGIFYGVFLDRYFREIPLKNHYKHV